MNCQSREQSPQQGLPHSLHLVLVQSLSCVQMCDDLDVDVTAAEVACGLVVVPALSWYNHQFNVYDPRQGAEACV